MGTPDATRRQAEIRPECSTVTRPGSPHESGISRRRAPGSVSGVVTLDRAWGGGAVGDSGLKQAGSGEDLSADATST